MVIESIVRKPIMIRVSAFVCVFMLRSRNNQIDTFDVYNVGSAEYSDPPLAFVMRLIGSILLLVTLSLPIPVYPISPEKQEPISLDQAAAIARSRTGGRVLSAETREVDGRLMYRIKILTPEGRVRSLYIDPRKKQ